MNRYYRTSLKKSLPLHSRGTTYRATPRASLFPRVYDEICCYTKKKSFQKRRQKNISRFFFKRNVTLNIKIDTKTLNSLEILKRRRRPPKRRIKDSQKKRSFCFVLCCFGFIHSFFLCVCVCFIIIIIIICTLSHHYISEEEEDVEYF